MQQLKCQKQRKKKEAGLLNGAKLRLLCHWVHQQRDGNTSLCCHGVLVVLHRRYRSTGCLRLFNSYHSWIIVAVYKGKGYIKDSIIMYNFCIIPPTHHQPGFWTLVCKCRTKTGTVPVDEGWCRWCRPSGRFGHPPDLPGRHETSRSVSTSWDVLNQHRSWLPLNHWIICRIAIAVNQSSTETHSGYHW